MLDRGRLLLLLVLLVSLSSCQNQRLVVETHFIDKRTLASSWVNTPNPLQYCPVTGQELIISWRLPEVTERKKELRLELTVRFGNREEETVEVCVNRFRGCYIYRLVDNDYWNRCGIMTYKVELYDEDCLIDCWHHQIWSNIIDLESNDEEEEKALLDPCC